MEKTDIEISGRVVYEEKFYLYLFDRSLIVGPLPSIPLFCPQGDRMTLGP